MGYSRKKSKQEGGGGLIALRIWNFQPGGYQRNSMWNSYPLRVRVNIMVSVNNKRGKVMNSPISLSSIGVKFFVLVHVIDIPPIPLSFQYHEAISSSLTLWHFLCIGEKQVFHSTPSLIILFIFIANITSCCFYFAFNFCMGRYNIFAIISVLALPFFLIKLLRR